MDDLIVTREMLIPILLKEIFKNYNRHPFYAKIISEIYKNLGD